MKENIHLASVYRLPLLPGFMKQTINVFLNITSWFGSNLEISILVLFVWRRCFSHTVCGLHNYDRNTDNVSRNGCWTIYESWTNPVLGHGSPI